MRFYDFANSVLRFLFRLLVDYRITGLEKVPREGGLIVCLNHTSFLDPLMVGAFLPRVVIMMSKVENFRNPLLGLVSRLYGAFPVRRGEVDRQALRRAEGVLREGKALLMAPEGTRSKTGHLQPGRAGTALLVLRTGAPVLPIGIAGGRDFYRRLARLQRTRVRINIGEPFSSKAPQSLPPSKAREAVTEEIMYRIAALLPEENRGAYSDQRRMREILGEG